MGLCDSRESRTKNEEPQQKHPNHPHHVEERPNSLQLKRKAEEGDLCMEEDELRKYTDQIFERYDRDEDGIMERKEVEMMFEDMLQDHKMEGKRKNLKYYVQNYMFDADVNDDGRITKKEFYRFYKLKG